MRTIVEGRPGGNFGVTGGAGGLGAAGGGAGSGAGGAAGGGAASGAGGFGGVLGTHGVAALVAGGLSGILAMGGLIATGIVPIPASGGGQLAIRSCMGSGPVLAVATAGQRLLVTARSADGAWLQVFVAGPAIPYGWAPTTLLNVNGDTGTLDIADCGQVAAATSSPVLTATPSESVAVASPSPTASPTAKPTQKPTPTPTATPKPNDSPALAGLKASNTTIRFPVIKPACNLGPTSTRFTISATDDDGIASVTLYYKKPGATTFRQRPMTKASGSTYAVSISVTSDGLSTPGTLAYYVLAKDGSSAGKTARSPSTGTKSVTIKKCNNPPVYVNNDISWPILVPLKNGPACSDSTTLYVSVGDPDGDLVTKVIFYYRPYGQTKWFPMKLSKPFGIWTGNLTNRNFPALPKAGSYAFQWYVQMTDAAGSVGTSPKLFGFEQTC